MTWLRSVADSVTTETDLRHNSTNFERIGEDIKIGKITIAELERRKVGQFDNVEYWIA